MIARMETVRRRLAAAVTVLSLFAVPIAGCSDTVSAKTATVTPGDMPSGASWDGVYYSELYGYLHLVQSGTEIKGKWERTHKDKWGELKGTATGDVIHFEWSEYTRGLVGPNAKHVGKGYFKYGRPSGDNVDDVIKGEIGHDQDEVGEPWEAIKQRNIKPNLSSIGGTGAMDIGGGDWDKPNNEKGQKPEPPASPK
jgi:hypothetical protein